MIVDSLPDRPLQRAEVDALDDSDSIQSTFPVYGERPEMRDTAYGVVIVADTSAHALVYDTDWEKIDSEPVESPGDGIGWSDRDVLDDLQQEIVDRLSQS